MENNEGKSALNRTITLPFITLYGVGTILGAGIYVLIGKVALFSGMHAPLAFIVAAFIAMFTGLSYAELSARFPLSAGEPIYVLKGLGRKKLSSIVGYLVILTGIVSAATIIRGFVGYFQIIFPATDFSIITGAVIALWACASFGVVFSVGIATLITVLEIGGLLYIVSLGSDSFHKLPELWEGVFVPTSLNEGYEIIVGAFIAFYAFIGFEDMVNMAEEVKSPEKNLPRALILAIVISTVLYILVSVVAVILIPLDELTTSPAPLAHIASTQGKNAAILMAVIGMITIINGALVQIIMGARVLYGMGNQGVGPKIMARVNGWTKTPVIATTFVTALIFVLAAWFPIVALAKITTFVILIVFTLVNASLIALKCREKTKPVTMNIPIIIPIIGVYFCISLLVVQSYYSVFFNEWF